MDTIRNSQGLRCRLNSVCTLLQEGWNRVNLARSDGKDGQDLFLDYCDGYAAAVGLWKDPAHSGKLVLKPVELFTKNGDWRYRAAHTGVWWNEMQVRQTLYFWFVCSNFAAQVLKHPGHHGGMLKECNLAVLIDFWS